MQPRQFQKAPIEADALDLTFIAVNRRTSDIAANTEDGNLPVPDRIGIGHTKDIQAGEMRTQDAGAVVQPLKWDHQNQNAFHSQPTVGVFEKRSLHASIRNAADLGVIRRIEVQKGKRFGLRNGVERVALDGLDAFGTRNARAFSIKFDAIAPDGSIAGHKVESRSLPQAGIDHRTLAGERS
jgi:hypothetical protein